MSEQEQGSPYVFDRFGADLMRWEDLTEEMKAAWWRLERVVWVEEECESRFPLGDVPYPCQRVGKHREHEWVGEVEGGTEHVAWSDELVRMKQQVRR